MTRILAQPRIAAGPLDMIRSILLGGASATLLFITGLTGSAAAASPVTFVSGLGNDTGTCTRAAPCRSFQYAIGQTSAGGAIYAIDAAGYGAVRITQSVTMSGPGKGRASVTPSAANNNIGIDIQAPGGTVVLRGLQVDGGANGISIGQAANVVISDSIIAGSSNLGINAVDTSASVLVQDTTVQSAEVDSNAATFVAKRLSVFGSTGYGVNPLAGRAVLDDCVISGSGSVNVAVYGSTTIVKNCILSNAGLRGVDVTAGSTGYLDRVTTFGNGQFSVIVGGTAYSYGTNNFPETTSGSITPIAGD